MMRRLFFALRLDDLVRTRLATFTRSVSPQTGRLVAVENLHLTLVFLGHVEDAQVSCIERVADGIKGEPFTLTLDCVGYWRRPRVYWIGAGKAPPPLYKLEAALRQGTVECGLPVDDRRFYAHVTLIRHVRCKVQLCLDEPISSRVSEFYLVESTQGQDGVRYQVLNSWTLAG